MLESWGLHWALITPCSQHYLLPLARQVNIHRPGHQWCPPVTLLLRLAQGQPLIGCPGPKGPLSRPALTGSLISNSNSGRLNALGPLTWKPAPSTAHSLSPPPASLGCPAEPQHHFLLHGYPSAPGLPDRCLTLEVQLSTPHQHWSDGQGRSAGRSQKRPGPQLSPRPGSSVPSRS